ncbi:heme biosynthesis HemY N-terminal domain-containing protein [Lichenihabitans sp. Uapishka_5]|uniref:heme biosynthesis protein HemY n=1 Tax=Lichenihabitans sp. Uapishka_5 TaxID=3037302 RepID=UPI0029E7D736|nr:heme biosynthesis HemY N-terminal domain-containing protein [Lichenihabitans sp. Uapishka_5]MDX7950007.1 heme biosynthesis HemY N-terminal domain-containing protein [Lichenihabitans sp. Uapishka_5]
MIRVLVFLAVVLCLAFGASWLADHPGSVAITVGGQEYLFSTLLGLMALVAAAVVLVIVWSLIRFAFQLPSLVNVASANRRKQRGYAALSRGMVAVGSGDADQARRYAMEAARLLKGEPMALLLKAQSAQLSGDRESAEQTFTAMLEHPETRTLALRGLYMEAGRRGDPVAALAHAEAAQKITTLPWSANALLQARAAEADWLGALRIVERNVGARICDRATGNRQRAALLAGLALDMQDRDPAQALDAARDALKLAPTLVPAAAVAGRLFSRKGDYRRASKILELAYATTPHPELANAYLHARPGDSAADRLARAETLARYAPDATESRLIVAHAAIDARAFDAARAALAPLVEAGQPTCRTCLTLADLEEAEHGQTGAVLEWTQRASTAMADPAWVADGLVSDTWAPFAPNTGRLDAYRWEVPQTNRSIARPAIRPLTDPSLPELPREPSVAIVATA